MANPLRRELQFVCPVPDSSSNLAIADFKLGLETSHKPFPVNLCLTIAMTKFDSARVPLATRFYLD
jgi:hypothetical protein